MRIFLKSFLVLLFTAGGIAALAQAPSAPSPVTFTSDQDHQNMMDQLGIKALRPGPSGNEKAPNHADLRRIEEQSRFRICPIRSR